MAGDPNNEESRGLGGHKINVRERAAKHKILRLSNSLRAQMLGSGMNGLRLGVQW